MLPSSTTAVTFHHCATCLLPSQPLVRVSSRGGGGSRKSDILLKTPPEPNLKRGGLGGGVSLCGGIVRGKGTPAPQTPPPQ